MKELTGRSPMKSPGRPSHRRECRAALVLAGIARGLEQRGRRACRGVSAAAGVRWFRERGGMPTFMLDPLSGRYLCFEEREEIALLRAAGHGRAGDRARRSGARRRRSRGSCAATRRRAAASWSTGRRSAQWKAELVAPGARRPRSSPPTTGCASTCRSGWPGRCAGPTGRGRGPGDAGRGRAATSRVARIAGGRRRGARSRSRTGCASTSPMMSRCGSPTRRSTSRSTCRAAARWRRELTACLRTGRALRVPRARVGARGKGFVTDEVMISERPAEADDRAVPGHWEGDLILGTRPLGDRHAGRAHQPLHDAVAPAADARARRPAGQERAAGHRRRRRGGSRRDRRRDRRPCPSSCAGR